MSQTFQWANKTLFASGKQVLQAGAFSARRHCFQPFWSASLFACSLYTATRPLHLVKAAMACAQMSGAQRLQRQPSVCQVREARYDHCNM
jgi:hypothetical protein